MTIVGPAATPCISCPYRRDVPSGIWAVEEYQKLIAYDAPTWEQPTGLFLCHQQDGRICAGWAGCHDGDHLLALRMAAHWRTMTRRAIQETRDYVSPVPLWDCGRDAACHGVVSLRHPSRWARHLIRRIMAKRAKTPKEI